MNALEQSLHLSSKKSTNVTIVFFSPPIRNRIKRTPDADNLIKLLKRNLPEKIIRQTCIEIIRK